MMSSWHVILTPTGVNSVWPTAEDAESWLSFLKVRGLIGDDSSVAPFDFDDDAHCMAARFSPQLNQLT